MKTHYLSAIAIITVFVSIFMGSPTAHSNQNVGDHQTNTAAYAKSGFYTQIEDGRLWVFKEGAKELEEFKNKGELAKHIIRPAAGPGGITLKAPDAETLDDYLSAQ